MYEVTFGRLFSGTFNALVYSPLGMLLVLVSVIVAAGGLSLFGVAGLLPGLALYLLACAVITEQAMARLEKRPTTAGLALGTGMSRLAWYALVVGVVGGLVALGSFVPVLGPILLARWYVAAPLVVVERLSLFAAMRRSVELTAGNRWMIFLLSLALGALFWVSIMAMESAVGHLHPLLNMSGLVLAFTFVGGIYATAGVVALHQVRFNREGERGRQVASVFA